MKWGMEDCFSLIFGVAKALFRSRHGGVLSQTEE